MSLEDYLRAQAAPTDQASKNAFEDLDAESNDVIPPP